MRHILLIIALVYSTLVVGQTRAIGTINDPDGYTNLRAGKGTNHEVLDQIKKNEVFVYYDSANQNWLKVAITRCVCNEPNRMYNEITGYIHRSRITNITELEPKRKRELLVSVFTKEKELYHSVISSTDRKSEEHRIKSGEMNVFHEYQFVPVLDIFEQYICINKDRELFNEYLDLLEIEEGSADEMPAYTLGTIFTCQPNWMFDSMKDHKELMNLLEWGIVNTFYGKPEEESNKLKNQYNELRESIGLKKTDFSIYEE